MKSEKECYRYNSIYKFFVHALRFDPPQPPPPLGPPHWGKRKGGEEKVP